MLPAAVLVNTKYPHNLAAAIRACSCFNVPTLLWTGQRFAFRDGERLPREERMKGFADVKVIAHERPFDALPRRRTPVCIELTPSAQPLGSFDHPDDAVYVFGPEDGHVPQAYRSLCHAFVYIESAHCLNLAAALNVVLYDRARKLDLRLSPSVRERRGIESAMADETIDIRGWDGA